MRRDSVGGGGSSRIFRGLLKPVWFSGGGGVVGGFFRGLRNFPWSPKAGVIQCGGGG